MNNTEATKTEKPATSASPIDRLVIPCPRLEFLWIKTGDDWRQRECVYSLVLPLGEYDIRHTDAKGKPTEMALEIGRTCCSGGDGKPPITEGKVDTPFRDYSHAMWDRKALGGHLPIIAVCEDTASLVDISPEV